MNLRHLITSGELEVHEPNSSSPLVIHDVNGTLFHRSWTRDHLFTTSMERSNSSDTFFIKTYNSDHRVYDQYDIARISA